MQRRGFMAAALGVAALATGLAIAGGAWKPPLTGLPDAGAFTTWLSQIVQLAGTAAGIYVIGALIVHSTIAPTTPTTVTHDGRVAIRRAGIVATLWALLSLLSGVLTLAVVLGIPFTSAAKPGIVGTYMWDLPASRSYVYVALIATIISICTQVLVSLNSMAMLIVLAATGIALPLLNSHSAALGDHSLAITSSVAHGLAAAIWVGGLWNCAYLVKRGDINAIRRFSLLATGCVSVLVLSGAAAAYVRMDSVSDLWQSGYGRLTVLKVVAFTGLAALAVRIRAALAQKRATSQFVVAELSLMALAIGLGVALHNSPFSRSARPFPSAAEDILGFAYPPAPTWLGMLTGWHPDWFIVACVTLAVSAYLVGMRRVDKWPTLHTLSFFIGLGAVLWATCSRVSMYAMVSFQAHMVAHMMLSMLAPIFLVLGAPITLALRALPAVSDGHERSPRGWLASLLHSRYSQLITTPLVVLVIFTFGLYGIYFTSAFSSLMSGHIGHMFMEVHFLLTGFLFAFTVIGIDPSPRPLPHWARLLMVLVAMSLHAFFAVAIMQATTPIGDAWYSLVRPPWIHSALDDTYAGGGVAWAIGEVPSMVLLVAVAVQWAISDDRLATRLDRESDRTNNADLEEYNRRLRALNERDERLR